MLYKIYRRLTVPDLCHQKSPKTHNQRVPGLTGYKQTQKHAREIKLLISETLLLFAVRFPPSPL